jgi:hypothetical protein
VVLEVVGKDVSLRATVKSFYLPHYLSKLFGFGKRVEAVRIASFFNRLRIYWILLGLFGKRHVRR